MLGYSQIVSLKTVKARTHAGVSSHLAMRFSIENFPSFQIAAINRSDYYLLLACVNTTLVGSLAIFLGFVGNARAREPLLKGKVQYS